jgi:tol-pal system protein YbgF
MIMKRLGFAVLIICLSNGLLAQGFSLTQPNAVGGNLVGMTQDLTSYETMPGMKLEDKLAIGPGIEFFLKYDVSPKFFLTIGTGINTINHPYTSDFVDITSARTTLLPSFELKAAYKLMTGSSFSPFLMAGLHGFGHTTTVKAAGQTSSSDRYYDGAVFVGGGGEVAINEKLSFQASGDLRFVVSSDADPQPQYWVAKAGLTYKLQGQAQKTPSGEEIEYPLGDDELASLDDLFKDTGSGQSGGDDFADLDLLFAPEQSGADTEYSDLGSSDTAYSGTGATQLQNRIQQLKMEMDEGFRQIQELEAKVQQNEQMLAGLSGNVAGAYAGVGSGERLSDSEFRQKYDAILARVNARQFREAIPAFTELMNSNPDHKLASNCQYWIGECYNALGDYSKAIAAFNRVMEYRSSYKFDDALIMTGVVSMKMGDNENAKQKFQELVNRYPDSEYAPKAMRYLGRL